MSAVFRDFPVVVSEHQVGLQGGGGDAGGPVLVGGRGVVALPAGL